MSTTKPMNEKSKKLRYYTEVFENTSDVIYVMEVTPDGEFIYLDINNAYTEVTGIPRETVIGLNVEKIENEAFRAILIDKFTTVLKAGEKTNYIADYPFPAGIRVFHSTLSPMFDESGRMHRIVGIARDITEYKRQNEQLALKDQEFRTLADNSPDVIVRYDAELNRTYSNPSWDRISAISSVGVLGEPTIEKTARPSHMATTYEMNLKKVLENRESGDVELTLMDENDKPLFFTQRLVPEYDSKGNVIGVLTIARDITPYKKLQETLQSREREFRSLAENQPENIARWDTQGRYLYINPTHEQTLGRSLAEVIGTRVHNEHTAVKEAIAQVAATGQKVLVHQRILGKNGEKMIHDVTIAPEFDSAGRLVSILGIGRDMSEHYKHERLLRTSEARFRHFFERQLVGMAITSPTHGWIQTNEKLQQMVGYTHEELTQLTWAEMTHPDDILADMEQFNRMLAGEIDDYMLEKRFIRKDRALIYTKIAISCIRHKDQTIDYVLALIEDITVRKHSEKRLQQALEFNEEVMSTIPDLMFELDAEGVYQNIWAQDEKLLATQKEHLLGKNIRDVLSHEAVEVSLHMMGEVDATGQSFGHTMHVNLPEGRKYFELSASMRKSSGTYIVLSRDVTERKRSEEAIRSQSILLQSVMESSPDVTIFALDREYNYLSFNHNHSLIMNTIWGHEIALGMNMLSCITHEDDKEKAKELFDKALAGESFIDESEYGDENLSRSYWQTYYAPMYNNNGETTGLTCFTLDITEKKVQEELLRQKEQESRALLNNLPGYVYTLKLSPEGELNFTYLSTGVAEVYGMNAEKLLDDIVATLHERIHPDDLPVIEANIIQSSQELTPFFAIYRIHHPVDGEKYLEARSVPEKLQDGTVIWHGIVLDVTDRKLQENRLHKTKAKLSAIITSIPDLIWVKDVEGAYMMCNPAFENFFGASCGEIIGKTDYDFVSREQADFFRQKDIEALEAGELRINEEEIHFAHNGEYALLETRKIPVYDGEEFMGILGVGRDITERKKMEETIAAKERQFRMLAEHTSDTIARYDHECIRLYANPAFAKAVGVKPEELLGKKPTDYNDSEQARGYEEAMKQVVKSGEEGEFEYSWPDKEGRIITSHIRIVPEKDENGMIHSVIGSGRDITERKRLEQKILTNQLRLNEAQKIAKVGSWELLFPGLHLSWSDEIYRIFEIDPDLYEPSYDHFLNAIHPDDRDLVDRVYAESLDSKTPYEVTHRILMGDGRIKYVHEKGETLYDSEGNPTRSIGTVQDVTQQKIVEKKIEHMAHHDSLTGLPNRILAKERAKLMLESAQHTRTKAAFLFLDLDGFKAINDSLGHSAGDAMLKTITTRLQECVRESDTISRQGGDEFLLILSEVRGEEDIGIIVDNILRELEKPLEIATHTLSVSGSIGIALYPDHGESFETLLQCADTAMYKAKDLGKNGYCFYTQQMNHNLIGQFKIQNDLKNALQNGEFVLHYQPQIDLSSNTIIGAEALIRWVHPQLGMIAPMSFIPIAESSGLIVPIGQWVIEESCRQAARWKAMGITITVAVNISAMQFKRGNLESVVADALAASKLDPHYLELELTESIIMHDTENTLQHVRNLKSLGVQLSIDDFGTGYSSLAYLKRFAVDKLKIDQSFIRDILQDQEDAVIVSTIVQMAKNLNLKTIAEGVETQEIVELITSYGCDEVQGYHYAKPLEAPDFENFHAAFGRENI